MGWDSRLSRLQVAEILPWRELYRQEMNCQIVHDSLHGREGWTLPYSSNGWRGGGIWVDRGGRPVDGHADDLRVFVAERLSLAVL